MDDIVIHTKKQAPAQAGVTGSAGRAHGAVGAWCFAKFDSTGAALQQAQLRMVHFEPVQIREWIGWMPRRNVAAFLARQQDNWYGNFITRGTLFMPAIDLPNGAAVRKNCSYRKAKNPLKQLAENKIIDPLALDM